jgi:AcrR family transcriptional regulator
MATKAETQKTRILDAFLGRLATMPFDAIELADVAADAGVSLSELRSHYDGRMALLDAFNRRIDLAVLERVDPAMADEPPRERLFDVLMRRFDALAPWREAVRMLDRSVRRDPMLALAAAPGLLGSMDFMLASARIAGGGIRGRLRTQALALAWARMVSVWLDDDDPGLARTMVAVDRELQRCERAERFAERLARFSPDVLRRPRRDDAGVAGEGI